MLRTLEQSGRYRDWQLVGLAGAFGLFITTAALAVVALFDIQWSGREVALAGLCGALVGMLATGAVLSASVRRRLSEQNRQLDGTLNSMIQGLCMFDAQDRLMIWNERYIEMYRLNRDHIWRGCALRDVLDARLAAGTFPLDREAYVADRQAALAKGEPFTLTVELADGRVTTVVYHAMAGGGWVAMHEDVTERVKAERALEQTRTFLHSVIENVPSPVIVKGIPDLRYLLVNRAAENYLGIPRAEMLGKTAAEVMPSISAERIEAIDRQVIASGQPMQLGEHANPTPGNGNRVVTATRLPIAGPDGKLRYLISLISDLTDNKRQEETLAHMAIHDLLTELPNRSAFSDCVRATLRLAAAEGQSFGVLCVDLDRFKTINDVFGHAAGDAVLYEVARRLENVSAGAFIARSGGDEFAIITPAGPQPETAELFAKRVSAALDADIEVGGHPLRIGLSVGVAIYPADGKDAATLMANADAALSRAKAEARGSIRFFEPAMDETLREKHVLQHDFRAALANGELTLHYQPQARIDGTIIGFEALARWRHPQLGAVPPSTFISLAEESGMIDALGEWVLRAACCEAASWRLPLRISVNLSPVQFQRGDLPRLVHEVLLETGLRPERLELEITEGVLIGDFERALGILRRLKNLGVRIAMDDFGSGYSSLSYLQSFPFDKIKIDRAFIANLGRSRPAAAIVRSVIALGHGLDLPVLAEGVETKEQLRFLAAEKCAEVQGYLIGKPKPIADYAEIVGRVPLPSRPDKDGLAAAS